MGFYSAQRFYADFSAVMTGLAVNEYHPRNLYYHLSFATGNKKCPLDMDRRIKNSDPPSEERSEGGELQENLKQEVCPLRQGAAVAV